MAADPRTRMALVLRIAADQRCGRGELALACVLLLHCYNSQTGRCDPSKRTLAAMTAMTERNVAMCTQRLQELGYLRIEVGAGTTTRYGRTNAYIPAFDGMKPSSWDEAQFPPQGVKPASSDEAQRRRGVKPASSKQGIEQGRETADRSEETPTEVDSLFPLDRSQSSSKTAKAPKRDARLYLAKHGCTIDSYQPDPERMGAWAAEKAPAVKNPVAPETVEDIKDVWRRRGEQPKDFDATYRTYLRQRQRWAAEANGPARGTGTRGFSYGHNT